MFKYDLCDIISIKNPIEISGKIIRRYIIFNKDGILKISYDIEANDPNRTPSRNIVLNIFEEDIIDQHKFNRLTIIYQFKYKIGDTVYALKNSYKIEYAKGLIVEQRYSESDTKIDYKYRIVIDGKLFTVEEKYLINEAEKQAIILTLKKEEESEPIIKPKTIKTDLIISTKKKQKSFQDIDHKLNILIEKIDHLDNKITDIENDLGNFGNNINENNNLLNSIDKQLKTKLNLLIGDLENNIIGNRAMLERIDNQFKELKDHIDLKIKDVDTSVLELHSRTII